MVKRTIYPPVWLLLGLTTIFACNEYFAGPRFTSIAGQVLGGVFLIIGLWLLVFGYVLSLIGVRSYGRRQRGFVGAPGVRCHHRAAFYSAGRGDAAGHFPRTVCRVLWAR